MVRIHMLLLVTVLELCVVFATLWLVWFFKARRLSRHLGTQRTQESALPAVAGGGAYFTEELVATRAQIDAQTSADPTASVAPLALRAAYLELEREFAQGRQRDAAFWDHMREQLGALLEAYAPAADIDELLADATPPGVEESSLQPIEDDTQPVSKTSVLDEFKEALGALLADQQQSPESRAHADKLLRCSRELALCVTVLEDDNNFLREKLKAAGLDHD